MRFLSSTNHHYKKWLSLITRLGIGILFLFKFSIATWSPHLHPQHQSQPLSSWQQDQQQQHLHPEEVSWRGGSTAVQSPPPPEAELQPQHLQPQAPVAQEDESFQPPKVHLKHVSMALRLTSEWNRRLSEGINKMKNWGRGRRLIAFHHHHQQRLEYHHPEHDASYSDPYGDLPVNVHPSRAWQPPIPATKAITEEDDDELTVFHAKTPYRRDDAKTSSAPRGVSHWGPDLQDMLQNVVSKLQLTEERVEIPLAMIYLDRACSVETQRSNNVVACPFCTPRTVHRLSLAALWMAMEAVHGIAGAQQMKDALFSDSSETDGSVSLSSMMDLSEEELQLMVGWMRAALGDNGLMVTVDQMKSWSYFWESIFSKVDESYR